MLQFLLNQTLRTEVTIDPNMTVLNYLRQQCNLTGTKEGCASGDCGACTVVVAEVINDQLSYRSINSCLTFMATLHGKQLITVEGLAVGKQLHSTQQAMVNCHGSQCGYCTPGFVMSLFALQKNPLQNTSIEAALAGNLCRCTGYRPIVEAANESLSADKNDQFTQAELQTIASLNAIQDTSLVTNAERNAHCFMPKSVEAFAQFYLDHPKAHILAGSTDLALEVTQFHRPLDILISLNKVDALQSILLENDHLVIGAAAKIQDCIPQLTEHFPDFGQLLQRFASLQIRNQATFGGNIANASPIGDSAPLLIALNASLQLRKGDQRRIIALDDFFLDYKKTQLDQSEFIEAIHIPLLKGNQAFKAYKVSKRIDDDISAVCLGLCISLENGIIQDARLGFGGMAALPKRAPHCEQALIGQPFCEATFQKASTFIEQDFSPLSDFRASQTYRLLVSQNLIQKSHIEISQDMNHTSMDTRVTSHV